MLGLHVLQQLLRVLPVGLHRLHQHLRDGTRGVPGCPPRLDEAGPVLFLLLGDHRVYFRVTLLGHYLETLVRKYAARGLQAVVVVLHQRRKRPQEVIRFVVVRRKAQLDAHLRIRVRCLRRCELLVIFHVEDLLLTVIAAHFHLHLFLFNSLSITPPFLRCI